MRPKPFRIALALWVLATCGLFVGCPPPEPEPTPAEIPLPDSALIIYESSSVSYEHVLVLYSDEARGVLGGNLYVFDKDIVDATDEQPEWLARLVDIAVAEGMPHAFVVKAKRLKGHFVVPPDAVKFATKVREVYDE